MVLSTSIELHDFPLVDHGVGRLLDVSRQLRRSNARDALPIHRRCPAGHAWLTSLPVLSSCTPQHQRSPSYFFGNDPPPPPPEAPGQVSFGRIVLIPSFDFSFYLSAPSKGGLPTGTPHFQGWPSNRNATSKGAGTLLPSKGDTPLPRAPANIPDGL
jgi:hypothetical protein